MERSEGGIHLTAMLCDTSNVYRGNLNERDYNLFELGRYSNRPLKITASCEINDIASLSITYDSDWTGFDGTIVWFWDEFISSAQLDHLLVPQFFWKEEINWNFTLLKENDSIRVIVAEKKPDSPPRSREGPRVTALIRYGQLAEIRIRVEAGDKSHVLSVSATCMQELYQGRMQFTEQSSTKEWALIGAFGDK
jgi:hypothetical protein